MKVTKEMIYAYHDTWHRTPPGAPGDRTRAGLAAVFQMIDPVPEDVSTIEDRDGDEWVRDSDDPMVWTHEDGGMLCHAYRYIEKRWGPITWEGKK